MAAGQGDRAGELARRAIAVNPDWPEFARRMVAAGHVPPAALEGLALLG